MLGDAGANLIEVFRHSSLLHEAILKIDELYVKALINSADQVNVEVTTQDSLLITIIRGLKSFKIIHRYIMRFFFAQLV